ncbi:MAG: lipoate--protein ligase family protein [Microcoleus sp. PH2017_04_SCI_O_A]|nr:lipoate--protein ligase family protein [Microcoleus sp. PH2017_04_SCI_O_A]
MANSVWRLIPLLSASGRVQMAIDKWLLEKHLAGKNPPTLRFYTWAPAAISLGYHQQRWPEFWQQLSWEGHESSRLKAYHTICEFLIEGWRAIGVDLHYGEAGRGYIHNPNCFGTATGADLVTVDGCKLIGSAQLRRGDAILQHGSMRLQPDIGLFSQVFGEELIPVKLPLSEGGDDLIATVIDALSAAACRCFDIDLEVRPLSEEEWEDIWELTQKKSIC